MLLISDFPCTISICVDSLACGPEHIIFSKKLRANKMTGPKPFLQADWPGMFFVLFNRTLSATRVWDDDFGDDQVS